MTRALASLHKASHTVPHSPSYSTSSLPLCPSDNPTSLTSIGAGGASVLLGEALVTLLTDCTVVVTVVLITAVSLVVELAVVTIVLVVEVVGLVVEVELV